MNSNWYWYPELGTYACATEDGMLTTRTLGEQIARGGGNAQAEADFWTMAAATLETSRVIKSFRYSSTRLTRQITSTRVL
jgi:hypothetical protein